MGPVEITQPPAASVPRPEPRHGVVIVYEARTEGRAALRYAHSLATERGVPLIVVTVAGRERTDVGCGSCRQGAMFRNEMACEFATSELIEARDTIASAPTAVAVDYVLARGSLTRVVPRAAADHRADLIVIPAQRGGRLRRAVSRDRVKLLSRHTAVAVTAAPGWAPDRP